LPSQWVSADISNQGIEAALSSRILFGMGGTGGTGGATVGMHRSLQELAPFAGNQTDLATRLSTLERACQAYTTDTTCSGARSSEGSPFLEDAIPWLIGGRFQARESMAFEISLARLLRKHPAVLELEQVNSRHWAPWLLRGINLNPNLDSNPNCAGSIHRDGLPKDVWLTRPCKPSTRFSRNSIRGKGNCRRLLRQAPSRGAVHPERGQLASMLILLFILRVARTSVFQTILGHHK